METQKTQENTDARNLSKDNASDSKAIKKRAFFLSWNNPPEDWLETLKTLGVMAKYYVFQKEIGHKEKTPHIQGAFYFNNAKSINELYNYTGKCGWQWADNIKACMLYCSKVDTREGETYVKGWKLPEKIEDIEPRGWQKDIIDIILKKPDKRTVYWFWEPHGGIGKTVLAKHICLNYDAIYVGGKAADVKCAIASMENKPKIVIWDIPRCMEDYVSYQGIEEVKNGIFFSGKYESGMVIYNCPHVICLANFPPELEKLSMDRWVMKRIENRDA